MRGDCTDREKPTPHLAALNKFNGHYFMAWWNLYDWEMYRIQCEGVVVLSKAALRSLCEGEINLIMINNA